MERKQRTIKHVEKTTKLSKKRELAGGTMTYLEVTNPRQGNTQNTVHNEVVKTDSLGYNVFRILSSLGWLPKKKH